MYQKEISIITRLFSEKYSVPVVIDRWDDVNFNSLLDLIRYNLPVDLTDKELSKFDYLVIKELERQGLLHILLH